MTTSATTLSKNGKKWIVGVRDKLSRRDGFQLLKILYHKDNEIQEGELDRAGNVYQVYTLSKNSTKDDGGAVALLYYRLTLLVPHSVAPPDGQSALDPDKLLTAKDLGAQDCLDYYEKCGLSRPGEPSVSPEARLPECFVMAYVNLSPPRRHHFKEQLSIAVGVYREKQLDLFNLFCRLSHGSSETTVDTFISALNNAEVPPMIFEQLQHQLDSHCIQHNPIDIEKLKTKEETVEDYNEGTPLLNVTNHYHLSGHDARVCTKSRAACCLIPMVLLLLVAMVVAVSTPIINHIHFQSEVESFETSINLYQQDFQCSTQNPTAPPVICLGTFSTNWYDGFIVTQDLPDKNVYEYNNLDVYVVESKRVIEHSRQFYCGDINTRNGVELELEGVYFLSGTNVSFNICILSTDLVQNGWVGIAFYGNRQSYDSNDDTLNYHRFTIGPNQSKCYPYNYMAPSDSFYYIRMGTDSQCSSINVTAVSFTMNADMRYINASDPWLIKSEKGACNRSDYSSEKECKFTLPRSSSVFPNTQEYDIFAKVTSAGDDFGHLSIQPMFNKDSLALPSVFGGIFLVPTLFVFIFISVVCVCVKWRRRSRNLSVIEENGENYGTIQ